jgi:probable phosphoglycerate mutase
LIGLLRHAPTQWNLARRIQGQQDSPLLAASPAAVRQWASRLQKWPWQRMVCSDSGRARQTAALINESLNVALQTDTRLREQDWGAWTGKTHTEVLQIVQRMPGQGAGWDFCPPGGESRRVVVQRAKQALLAAHRQGLGEALLVVTHAGLIRCLLKACLDHRFVHGEPVPWRNGHLHLLQIQADQDPTILELNAVALPLPDLSTSA